MARFIEKHKKQQILVISDDKHKDLSSWIEQEIEDAISSRAALAAMWRECLRMYAGVPKQDTRNVPVPNAPNIEITIGAIAADTIYAQSIDLIFNTAPLATVRAKPKFSDDKEMVATAKAMQKFVNHLATSPDMGLREAVETGLLDDIQLGTGTLYTPYVEKTKKTKTAKVLSAGPKVYPFGPEDVIVPGGSSEDVQAHSLIGLRSYYTLQQLKDAARVNSWDIEGAQPLHEKDFVRSTREALGKQIDGLNRRGALYDVIRIYCFFDVDGDGVDEDLFVVWNRSGKKILYVGYAVEDSRPINTMVYQKQAHLFYGLGVMQMMKPYEEKLSDIHNYATLNVLLANSRVWVGNENVMDETTKIWPGKFIPTQDASKDLQALQMADVYPSIWQDQSLTMQLANQRVGINDVSRGSNIPSRTPGVTAMSFLQQVNRRFTPAFDSMKRCIVGVLKQACYRYQERLKSGDQKAQATIFSILGWEDGNRVIEAFRQESFDEHVDLELTAASASTNQEADRQSAIMLTNILLQYFQRTIELVTLAANPQTPPEIASVARKVSIAASEIIDRTIRTFDQVRDPGTFIVDIEEELDAIQVNSGQQQALTQFISAIGQGLAPQQQVQETPLPPEDFGGAPQ